MLIAASVVTYRSDLTRLHELLDSFCAACVVARQRCSDLQMVFRVVINDTDPEEARSVERLVTEFTPRFPGPLEFISGHGNVGYGAAHNLAWRKQAADYYLFLNPDLVLEPEGIFRALMYMESNPQIVMATPQGYDPQGDYAYLAKRNPNLLVLILRALSIRPGPKPLERIVRRYVYADCLPAVEPRSVEHASGCFMFCRHGPLQAIDGFDEWFFLFFEDYDLSRRIRKFGPIMELPTLRVVHYGGGAIHKGLWRLWLFAVSACKFFFRYGLSVLR